MASGLAMAILLFASSAPYSTAAVLSRSHDGFDPLEVAIAEAYAETGVPVEYIRGVVAQECGNDLSKDARNRNGTVDHGPGLNSRWLDDYAWRFNGGRKVDPHSIESVLIVGRILAANHRALEDWDKTISSYRWGVGGTRKYGIDRQYVNKVKEYGTMERGDNAGSSE